MSSNDKPRRPYGLTDDDYMLLLHALHSVRLLQYMADSAREGHTIEIDLMGSAMFQLADMLGRVMKSVEG